MLDREQIRSAIRGPVKLIDVPEWGGAVGIRRLSAADLVRIRGLSQSDEPDESEQLQIVCETLAMGLCDEAGASVFTAEELRAWDGQQMDVMYRLLAEIQSHNGMGKAIEGSAKNSESGPTSEST